ncbi:MAG: insulinase family protein [Ignavibacteria bacterium]|nr:insulinase family protein [Ignavibacteria bacterium]
MSNSISQSRNQFGTSLNIPFEKYELANGLQVVLHEDHTVPIVSVNIWYHVGGANEKLGRTGFAHLFEHLMFEGSENVRDGQYDQIVDGSGGQNNGSTGFDATNYWSVVPSNNLEPVLWLESDRMGFLLPGITQDRLDLQRDVVKNERRQSYENQPYGMSWMKLFDALYPQGVPYNWLPIGSQEDLTAASLDDVKDFFRIYYAPNNASLVIGGDIDIAKTKQLVEKYFGSIPRGKEIPRPQPTNVSLNETKRMVLEDNVQLPRLYMFWLSTSMYENDDASLALLSDILSSGKNSRLYKSLVYEKQIAQDVSAFQDGNALSGDFGIIVTAKEGYTLSEMEQAVNIELEKIKREGIEARELQRSKNSIRASFIYGLQNVGGFGSKTDKLNFYNTFFGNPGRFNEDLQRYETTTANDIQNATKKYLDMNKRVVLSIVPKGKLELQAK